MKKFRLILSCVSLLLGLVCVSCKDDENLNSDTVFPEVSASNDNVVLDGSAPYDEAVKFSWTKGEYDNVTYILQMVKAGGNFNESVAFEAGEGVYEYSFTNQELNKVMKDEFNVTGSNEIELDYRIHAKNNENEAWSQSSQFKTIKVKTYDADEVEEPVEPSIAENLYLYGTALPEGAYAKMQTSYASQNEFVWRGDLQSGNYKFVLEEGTTSPSYNKGSSDNAIVYEDEESEAGFAISENGGYEITVNVETLTHDIKKLEGYTYYNLWIQGSATNNELVIMTPYADNTKIFYYFGELNTGTFKINTTADGSGDSFYASDNSYDLTYGGIDLTVSKGSSATEWQTTYKDLYMVVLDTENNKIDFARFSPCICGDAIADCKGQFNRNLAPAMEQSDEVPYIYRWEGEIVTSYIVADTNESKEAEGFKMSFIECGEGSITPGWSGYWIYAEIANKVPTGSEENTLIHFNGQGDDNKWKPDAAGSYTIELNIITRKVKISH